MGLSDIMMRFLAIIESIPSTIFYALFSAYPFLLWWLWEYVCIISSTSLKRKYEPFAIVYGKVIKPKYALYALL